MKTVCWSIFLGLTSTAPALAAPGWTGGKRGSNGDGWSDEGWNEATKFSGWGESSPFKPGFSKPGSPTNWGPSWSGTCGGKEGKSCDGSWAGQCCSKDGQCGSTNLHCGEGCQPEFGKCALGVETTAITAPVPSSYSPSSYSSILSSLSAAASSAETSTIVTSTATSTAAHKTTGFPLSSPSSKLSSLSDSSNSSTLVSRVRGNFSTTSQQSDFSTGTLILSSSASIGVQKTMSTISAESPSAIASSAASALNSPFSTSPVASSIGSTFGSSSSQAVSSPILSSAASSSASSGSSPGSLVRSSTTTVTAGSSTYISASVPMGSSVESSAGHSQWTSSATSTASSLSAHPSGASGYSGSATDGAISSSASSSAHSTIIGYTGIGSFSTGISSPAAISSETDGYKSRTSDRPTTISPPVVTPSLLPNITTSLNTTKPSNITSACTKKPTPQCIPCEGTPDPSAPWCGYDINTDFYEHVPRTCKTVEYDFIVTNTTISPDGVPRMGLFVNGQMPGPTIEANWGDTVVVRLTNNLPADSSNGTSIHFHGVRQNYTNEMDGVPSITQCPLAPGESMTYTWLATQYGTSWYHSHFQLQAWEGVFGPIVIHGPSSADYDIDMGPVVLQDWSHQTVDEMYDAAENGQIGGPRVLDTGLINGMNVFGADGASNQTGERYQLEFIPGKKHLLRIVNTAIQSTFKFYIDGHKLQVISTDFVPIKPYTTNILNINIGQRYDVIVEADQRVGDYWMRSDNQNACAVITYAKNIKGIVHYAGGPESTPTSTGYNYTSECVDEPLSSLVPVVPYTVGVSNTEYDETVVVSANNSLNLYRWYLYGTTGATPETFQSEWSDPTLYEIWKNDTVPPYSGGLALKVPELKEWVYIVIESPIPLPHPIHLHGHDFYVLGSGSGTYDSSASALNLNNPPRRDVALLPTAGYLVLAFQTDNPGVWLMHCHIGWHTSMGFAMQIVEAQDLIKPSIDDTCLIEDTCKSWRKYANSRDLVTTDSGV